MVGQIAGLDPVRQGLVHFLQCHREGHCGAVRGGVGPLHLPQVADQRQKGGGGGVHSFVKGASGTGHVGGDVRKVDRQAVGLLALLQADCIVDDGGTIPGVHRRQGPAHKGVLSCVGRPGLIQRPGIRGDHYIVLPDHPAPSGPAQPDFCHALQRHLHCAAAVTEQGGHQHAPGGDGDHAVLIVHRPVPKGVARASGRDVNPQCIVFFLRGHRHSVGIQR